MSTIKKCPTCKGFKYIFDYKKGIHDNSGENKTFVKPCPTCKSKETDFQKECRIYGGLRSDSVIEEGE